MARTGSGEDGYGKGVGADGKGGGADGKGGGEDGMGLLRMMRVGADDERSERMTKGCCGRSPKFVGGQGSRELLARPSTRCLTTEKFNSPPDCFGGWHVGGSHQHVGHHLLLRLLVGGLEGVW
eukprot:1188239-Prorocentrum_minimum.AAC.2